MHLSIDLPVVKSVMVLTIKRPHVAWVKARSIDLNYSWYHATFTDAIFLVQCVLGYTSDLPAYGRNN